MDKIIKEWTRKIVFNILDYIEFALDDEIKKIQQNASKKNINKCQQRIKNIIQYNREHIVPNLLEFHSVDDAPLKEIFNNPGKFTTSLGIEMHKEDVNTGKITKVL
jgi:hypothetical protein